MEMSADNVVRDNETSRGEQPARSQSPQQQCLREHEPLTDILSLIPHKVQRGMKMQYEILELTALDANQYFIALGSNIGTVFLYDRAKHKIERLRSENTTDIVTCVCLHHGLDDLVAVGHSSGTIYIFQLPSILIGHSKQLERFIVSDVHQMALTCLTWSTNGMKLFSGDKQGCVGCTEVDFIEGKCQSSVLLIEGNTEIIQLNHGHKRLLVSTKQRCVVCRTDAVEKITQVGSKERKVAGDFGACFIPAMCKPENAQLYASRPGFRIWKASVSGSVLHTYMFKELLNQSHYTIPIIDFKVTNIIKSQNPNQFCQMLLFRDKELVTWNDSCVYLIDPENSSVIGSQKHIGLVKNVAVTDCEIFVLRAGTDRNLIRISDRPITRPTSLLLKQLEIERQQKGQHPVVKSKDETIEKKPEHVEKSPFKVFQGNIFEKVKQIANPVVLVDKVQEKLHIEKKAEHFGTAGVNCQTSESNSAKDEDLPPVVQLNSPDLMTIEVGQMALADSSPERLDGAIGNSFDTQPGRQSEKQRTGSGAFSALARLQEDHQAEENSDPVYRIANHSEETASIRISGEVEPEGDGIVFKRKVKKKKKKGSKEKSPLKLSTKVTDSDSVSVNSNTSIASDGSETSSVKPSTNEDSGRFSAASQQDFIQQSVEEEPGKHVPMETREDNQEKKPTFVEDVDKNNENVSNKESIQMISDKTDDVEIDVETDNKDKTIADSISVSSDSVKTVDQILQSKEDQKKSLVTDFALPVERRDEINTLDNIAPKVNAEFGLPVENSKSDKISNLDREMARLDSYLSETTDTYTGQGNSTSPIEFKSEADQLTYRTIMGRSDSVREREILDSMEVKDSKYIPSSLEKELNELEQSAQGGSNKTMDMTEDNLASSIFTSLSQNSIDPNSKPSFYTIFNKPGATAEDFYSQYEPTSPKVIKRPLKIKTGKKFFGIGFLDLFAENGQISVSPDGNIVWALNKYTVYAGTKITPRRPEGMKWVEAVRDVSFICVDNNCAWYMKTNHQVMIQKGLCKDRPCYTGVEVTCKHRLKQIVCLSGVVWALTENCHWLYRAGITADCPEGTEWKSGDSMFNGLLKHGSENRLFSQLCLGEDNIGWAVDILGQCWFLPGVTMKTPRGENHWWQVPLSGEYVVKDMTALDMLKSFSKKFDPQKLTLLLSAQSGGLIAAHGGVWVCPEYKHILQVCRGNVEGQLWRDAHPESLASTSCWKTVVASTANQKNGVIWAQQPSGDIFAFSPDRKTCCAIPGPSKLAGSILFVCLSVCTDALWALSGDGEVYIRTGMSELECKGTGWSQLDLSQLEDKQLVNMSCADMTVWSVDSDGMVWHRIGVKAPSDLSLNAAWLPVDNGGTVFTHVVSCQQDWKVWAIDNRRQVYVRDGITQEMPIGRKWIHVSGSPAMQLTLSNNFVFALNHAGELLCRHGVAPDHVTGDYWKKLPGELTHISATPNNILWGINKDGQLVRRFTKYIVRSANDPGTSGASRHPREHSVSSEDGEWEFV
ncbi:tectonin beta-propeller repeat-containing protein 2-like [Ruditapes philippinarum]|uniref:tectonin beta-propeller repeat-containing protein 2-like n=1 Tax=Ruditapes philippinarum TaxID=129788 RepID=UPI00295B94B3|nr:tectonin beta-propeller repeat-containing protein 2-like [Ruditapes philippinarum]